MAVVGPTDALEVGALKTYDPLPTRGLGSREVGDYDFDKKIVPGLQSDRFVSAKALMLAAGPPTLEQLTGQQELAASPGGGAFGGLKLLGATQDFNLQQNTTVQDVFEIGSRAIYKLAGRTTYQISLGRMMFFGPTLLRALYEGAKIEFPPTGVGYKNYPGLSDQDPFFLNLGSIFFENPTGLYVRAGTIGQRSAKPSAALGAAYLEEGTIMAHGMSASAQSGIVSENVVLTFTANVPVQAVAGQAG